MIEILHAIRTQLANKQARDILLAGFAGFAPRGVIANTRVRVWWTGIGVTADATVPGSRTDIDVDWPMSWPISATTASEVSACAFSSSLAAALSSLVAAVCWVTRSI